VVEHGIHDGPGAVNHVDHAGWQIYLVDEFENAALGHGDLFRGLHDESVAADKGIRHEPERHHGRKVERGDAAEDAHRLPVGAAVDVLGYVFQAVAGHHGRDAGCMLEVFYRSANFPPGLVYGFSLFPGEGAGYVLEVLLHEVPQTEKITGSSQRGSRAPFPESCLRRLNGPIEIVGGGIGHGGDFFSPGGVPHRSILARGGIGPFSIDVVLYLLHDSSPFGCRPSVPALMHARSVSSEKKSLPSDGSG